MENTTRKSGLRLVGMIDITADKRCREAYLACFAVCDSIAFFILQSNIKFKLRLSDRSSLVGRIKLCGCDDKAALAHSIYIKYRKIGSI